MHNPRLSKSEWMERIIVALFLIGFGGLIMIVFKPWGTQSIPNRTENYLWRFGLCIFLLILAGCARGNVRLDSCPYLAG